MAHATLYLLIYLFMFIVKPQVALLCKPRGDFCDTDLSGTCNTLSTNIPVYVYR